MPAVGWRSAVLTNTDAEINDELVDTVRKYSSRNDTSFSTAFHPTEQGNI